MGSKFHELLQPSEIRDRDLSGQAVAVDGTAWLHQFLKVTLASPSDPGNRLVPPCYRGLHTCFDCDCVKAPFIEKMNICQIIRSYKLAPYSPPPQYVFLERYGALRAHHLAFSSSIYYLA
nr:hypothetical protein [Candidatus Sigynarchaeota archaeon]